MADPGAVGRDDVRAELTDILGQVVGAQPDAVTDRATLEELGVDSLAIVEVTDELGRRFGVHLADDTVNRMQTVGDAVDAVVRHDGTPAPRVSTNAAMAPPSAADAAPPEPEPEPQPKDEDEPVTVHTEPPLDDEERKSAFRRLAWWFAGVGAAVGVVLGLGSAAIIGATGITETNLPPLAAPTTPAPSTATPTPTPTPTPDEDATPDPDPTLTIPRTDVAPGERFTLEGAFPALKRGETLQVQVKDPGAGWDEFPVTATTRQGGTYRTQIYTSRTGQREFRMLHRRSDATTPAVQVTIGR